MGAFAEYAVVAEDLVGRMPESLDFDEAAALPLAGLTALQGLRDKLAVKAGDRLLITGGAGGRRWSARTSASGRCGLPGPGC